MVINQSTSVTFVAVKPTEEFMPAWQVEFTKNHLVWFNQRLSVTLSPVVMCCSPHLVGDLCTWCNDCRVGFLGCRASGETAQWFWLNHNATLSQRSHCQLWHNYCHCRTMKRKHIGPRLLLLLLLLLSGVSVTHVTNMCLGSNGIPPALIVAHNFLWSLKRLAPWLLAHQSSKAFTDPRAPSTRGSLPPNSLTPAHPHLTAVSA
jgi:hypothetical protein